MSRASKDNAPLCVHAHRVPLPLLADFPKRRIDINPFLENQPFEGGWGRYSLSTLKALFPNSSEILIFLDSFTVGNIEIIDFEDFSEPVTLFIGDTQHGSLDGFCRLINLSKKKCVTRLIFANNPQHAHWFADSSQSFQRFKYVPLGFANRGFAPIWAANHVREHVVHVGNVSPSHAYRQRVLADVTEVGSTLMQLVTSGYKAANSIHKNALASVNISLNSDISFRLSEIINAGGLCFSDRLGKVQSLNFPYLNSENFFCFDNSADLVLLIEDIKRDFSLRKRKRYLSSFKQIVLDDLYDLEAHAAPIIEPRLKLWSHMGPRSIERLRAYLTRRDRCLAAHSSVNMMGVNSDVDFDGFIDSTDLPRLVSSISVSERYHDAVRKVANEMGLCEPVSIDIQPVRGEWGSSYVRWF
jgi:hypothetical protein